MGNTHDRPRARAGGIFAAAKYNTAACLYKTVQKYTKQVVNSAEMEAAEVIDNWSDIESAVSSDESDEREESEESEDSQASEEESEDSSTDDQDTPDTWTEVTGNV